jgi:hypothetical protein
MEERRNAIVFSFFSSFIEKENGVKRPRNSYFLPPLFSVSFYFVTKKGEKIKKKFSHDFSSCFSFLTERTEKIE